MATTVMYERDSVLESAIKTAGVTINFAGLAGTLANNSGVESSLFVGVVSSEVAFSGGGEYEENGLNKVVKEAISTARNMIQQLTPGGLKKFGRAMTEGGKIFKSANAISNAVTGYSVGTAGWNTRKTFSGSQYPTWTMQCKLTADMLPEGKSVIGVIRELYVSSMSTNAASTSASTDLPEKSEMESIEFMGTSLSTEIENALGVGGVTSGGIFTVVRNPKRVATFSIGRTTISNSSSEGGKGSAGFILKNFSADVSQHRTENDDYAWANISVTVEAMERNFGSDINISVPTKGT